MGKPPFSGMAPFLLLSFRWQGVNSRFPGTFGLSEAGVRCHSRTLGERG